MIMVSRNDPVLRNRLQTGQVEGSLVNLLELCIPHRIHSSFVKVVSEQHQSQRTLSTGSHLTSDRFHPTHEFMGECLSAPITGRQHTNAIRAHESANQCPTPHCNPHEFFSSTMTQQEEYWEGRWKGGIEKGARWDVGFAEPELVHEVQQGSLAPPGPQARALVPGCGRGYVVKALAELGYAKVVGLDLSETGVQVALQDNPHPRATFIHGDFFAASPQSLEGEFDLIFDSTFLCAIPPELRQDWAKQMVSLLKPEGGKLALNVFPVSKNPDMEEIGLDGPFGTGPPFRLTLNLVRTLLAPYANQVKEVLCREIPPERLSRANTSEQLFASTGGGTEFLMVWQRNST